MAEVVPQPPLVPMGATFLSPAPPDVTEFLLVRHGQQEVPASPRATIAERADPPLSATGRRQAKVVAAALAEEDVAAVYTSTLSRARDTGAAIGAHHDLDARTVPGIEEIGLFREMAPDASPGGVRTSLAGAAALFARDRCWDAYPYSEPGGEFRRRVVVAIEGLIAAHPGELVVVACHGGVINAYLGWVIGVGHDMWFRPAHASVSRFRALGSQRSLISVNERNHLLASDPALVTY